MSTKKPLQPKPKARRACLWCLTPMNGRRPQARFCSDTCRAMHHKSTR